MISRTTESTTLLYSRVAGFTFLFYIAAGITGLAWADRAGLGDVVSMFTSLCALVLGVTLYALTREQGPMLALLAMTCRILEAAHVQSAIFFAIGSTLFCWLLLRGRLIPLLLAWLGVIASALLAIILSLQLAGLFGGAASWSSAITWLVWLPMLVFEVTFALWLLIKGISLPQAHLDRVLESA